MDENHELYNVLGISDIDTNNLVFWTGDHNVGFSVFKPYPQTIPFLPVKNKDGSDDSVAMIKIGYIKNEINVEESRVRLLVSVYKTSQYLGKHFHYNFDDPECPTRESVEASERSKQPVDLDEFERFVLDLKTLTVTDQDANKIVTGNEIVDYIYNKHLKTTKAIIFRSKLKIKNLGISLPDRVIPFLKLSLVIFGREIVIQDKEDYWVGVFKTYSYAKHVRQREIDKINFLGIPVPQNAAIMTAGMVSILLIINYYFNFDIFHLVRFFSIMNQTQLFMLSLLIIILYSLDYFPSRIILSLINASIRIRNYFSSRPIHF